jgi:hypothetical protein
LLVILAAVGGIGYAKQGGGSKKASPAAVQYKFTLCHLPPGNPGNRHSITVGSEQAVEAHLRNHSGDHPGEC